MEVVLILYGIFVIAGLIGCTMSRVRRQVRYIIISKTKFEDVRRSNENLIVVDIRQTAKRAIPDALKLDVTQFLELVRWIPPGTTLVVCGESELSVCRRKIEMSLLSLCVEVVYVLEEGWDSSMHSTTPKGSSLSDIALCNWDQISTSKNRFEDDQCAGCA